MPQQYPVTYYYVYFTGGPGRTRQPRPSSGPGGFTLFYSAPGGMVSPGDLVIPQQPLSSQLGVFTQAYQIAFINISGGTPAGAFWADLGKPAPQVMVDAAPIVVMVVYVPWDGPPPILGGGSGVSIDSFDLTTNQLFDDTFVSVSPNLGSPPTPTTAGNVNGYVDTTNATETITALSPTSPTGAVFVQWLNLYAPPAPGVTVAGASLTVEKGMSAYALALYQPAPPPPPPPPPPDPCAALSQQLADVRGDIGDFPSLAAWEKAVEAAEAALAKCEEAHGGI